VSVLIASVMSEASRRFEPSDHYVRYNSSLKAPVAQWIERQPSKLRVRGSSPFRRATSPQTRLDGGCSSVWLERQVVALEAAGSNPVIHPTLNKDFRTEYCGEMIAARRFGLALG
jgi:hypothetical protein